MHLSASSMIVTVLILHLIGVSLSQDIDKIINNEITDDLSPLNNNNNQTRGDPDFNPDEYLTTPQIIRRHGYTSESYVVETSDGFLLTLHRISASKNGKIGKQPVFLQHGLLGSSADWVVTGNKSLAFMLSDLGYDVWLGNARGNSYSKAHTFLSPDSAQFWNFSFHEMGVYDLPTMLTYVSNVTGKQGDIIYIGHSMGTTMFFVYSSILNEMAKSTVKVMVALAPVAYMTHIKSPIRYFAPWTYDLQWLAKYLGIKEFLPSGKIMDFLSYGCELLKINKKICEQVIFAICGFDEAQFDENLLPVVLGHDPAGSSVKTIIHYSQEIHHEGNFMEFDYGPDGNLIEYGTTTPPHYNLTNIDVPTYFMFAENDWLANPIDVFRLSSKVANNIGLYDVPLKSFNHVDFLWAKDAPKLVYNKLIQIIETFPL